MPPKKRGAATKSRDDNDSPQPSKRIKNSSTAVAPSGEKLVDDEGKPYWELSHLRRVTISEFKGHHLINIREYYEKDGKCLPGKKGISLSVDQFNNLLSVLPQIDSYLADIDIPLTRPMYGLLGAKDTASKQKQKQKEQADEEEDGEDEETEQREEETKGGDEEEEEKEKEEEEEEEEEEEVKPKKKKPVQKKAEPKQKKLKAKARTKKRTFQSDAESD